MNHILDFISYAFQASSVAAGLGAFYIYLLIRKTAGEIKPLKKDSQVHLNEPVVERNLVELIERLQQEVVLLESLKENLTEANLDRIPSQNPLNTHPQSSRDLAYSNKIVKFRKVGPKADLIKSHGN